MTKPVLPSITHPTTALHPSRSALADLYPQVPTTPPGSLAHYAQWVSTYGPPETKSALAPFAATLKSL